MSIKRSIPKIKLQNVALLVLIAFAILGLTYFLSKNPQIISLNNSFLRGFLGEGRNEASLKNKHEIYAALIKEQKYDEVYDRFLAETEKEKTSREKYINDGIDSWKELKERGVENADTIINKVIIVRDNFGFVDTTSVLCSDIDCNDIKKSFRRYSVWTYLNNRWYKTSEQRLCIRDFPYEKPAEFDRAYNLIAQRFEQTGRTDEAEFAEILKNIKNCVDIQYASSDEEMNNAEGFFSFNPGDSFESLTITVSPRYSVKDDLITAVLLTHELTHVMDYLNDQRYGRKTDCYELEARAFEHQNYFLTILNEEERESIAARGLFRKSQELNQILDVYFTIPKYSGSTYSEQALNFVKSSEFYQDQCSNFSN